MLSKYNNLEKLICNVKIASFWIQSFQISLIGSEQKDDIQYN